MYRTLFHPAPDSRGCQGPTTVADDAWSVVFVTALRLSGEVLSLAVMLHPSLAAVPAVTAPIEVVHV